MRINNNIFGIIGLIGCLIYIFSPAIRNSLLSAYLINHPVVFAQQATRPAQLSNRQDTINTQSPTPSPVSFPQPQYSGYCLNVPILMYHHIQPTSIAKEKWQTNFTVDSGTFDNQMAYLANSGYITISLNQLVQALITHQKLPSKSIVLTFDDGYYDIYTYAYPISRKYNIKANLMISTGLIDSHGHSLWSSLSSLRGNEAKASPTARSRGPRSLEIENSDYLTWKQIGEMASSDLVSVHNHTWSHKSLGSANSEKIRYEIQTASDQLEKYLGIKSNIFAYPYGSQNSDIHNILKENGFIAAVSTQPGTVQCDSFLISLHRTRIGNSHLNVYGL